MLERLVQIYRMVMWDCSIKEDGQRKCIRLDNCNYKGEEINLYGNRWECHLYDLKYKRDDRNAI